MLPVGLVVRVGGVDVGGERVGVGQLVVESDRDERLGVVEAGLGGAVSLRVVAAADQVLDDVLLRVRDRLPLQEPDQHEAREGECEGVLRGHVLGDPPEDHGGRVLEEPRDVLHQSPLVSSVDAFRGGLRLPASTLYFSRSQSTLLPIDRYIISIRSS